MKFDIIPVKFPHYAHYLANYNFFLFNADGCGARKTTGTDGIATCWEWESSRSRVSRRRPQTPHPQTNYCRPQRRQWQSRHKHSTWSSRVTVPRVYYSRKITHYARMLCSIYYSQNYAGIIYASLVIMQHCHICV